MKNKIIGFVGLGIMGRPMAINLVKAGYSLVVFDLNPTPVEELVKMGAQKESSPAEVAKKADIIITMLPNSPEVRTVCLAEDGIIKGAKPGTILVDMSSIAPLEAIDISKQLAEKGIKMLDAPVSGGEPKAIDGTLAIMVGGNEDVFNSVKDLLLVMGQSATLVGEIGSGNTTKLANQIIVALNIAAMSEAMVLATKAGVNPEKVFNAIKGGLAGSTVLNAKMPMVLEGNFNPGFRIELHIKDLNNAADTSSNIGLDLPLTSKVLEMMNELNSDGKGKNDHGGLIQYYEKVAKVEVRK